MSTVASRAICIDEIEYARGILCSLSFVAPDASRPVHITRLQKHFDHAGIAAALEVALSTLRFVREIEHLGGGYWIPTPIRVVELSDKYCLIVGAHPTAELRRHFQSVRRAGAGRVVEAHEVVGLPRQSLAAWRGQDGINASAWARAAIESSIQQLAPSIGDEGLEVFGTRVCSVEVGVSREPIWVRSGDAAACCWSGVGLFRARTSGTRFRYFLGRHQIRSAFSEGPPVWEQTRMQFGLAALLDKPLTIKLALMGSSLSITLPLKAPKEVRRLLVALCEDDRRSSGCKWTCRNLEYFPALYASLQELECETAQNE